MRRCSCGFVTANGSRALKRLSRKTKLKEPWYAEAPAFVTISIRPRPGRRNSGEYGFWLIFASGIADAGSETLDTCKPSMIKVAPPVPRAPESRNRDIVAI